VILDLLVIQLGWLIAMYLALITCIKNLFTETWRYPKQFIFSVSIHLWSLLTLMKFHYVGVQYVHQWPSSRECTFLVSCSFWSWRCFKVANQNSFMLLLSRRQFFFALIVYSPKYSCFNYLDQFGAYLGGLQVLSGSFGSCHTESLHSSWVIIFPYYLHKHKQDIFFARIGPLLWNSDSNSL